VQLLADSLEASRRYDASYRATYDARRASYQPDRSANGCTRQLTAGLNQLNGLSGVGLVGTRHHEGVKLTAGNQP
jgi:hypothetical protein